MTSRFDCILGLSKLQAHLNKVIDRQLSVHGITFSEFYILHCLATAGDGVLRRIDLAEQVEMSASGVTRALNPMEKLKLVQKEQNPRDARVSLVKLSRAGERVYRDARVTVASVADTLTAGLGTKEISCLLAVMEKFEKGMG